MPESILQEPTAYLNTTATDGPYVAVLCDLCKHGQPYSVKQFAGSGKTHNLDRFEYGELSLFFVSLECENKSCDIRTKVYMPKETNQTLSISDVKNEMLLWTLNGIRCRCGTLVRVQESAEPQQIRFGADLDLGPF